MANGVGAYAGEYVQIANGIEYAEIALLVCDSRPEKLTENCVAPTAAINATLTKPFFIGGMVGIAPAAITEPATFATLGLAAAPRLGAATLICAKRPPGSDTGSE